MPNLQANGVLMLQWPNTSHNSFFRPDFPGVFDLGVFTHKKIPSMDLLILIVLFLSFLLSASCGMGGSLILIPALSIVFGIKEGIMISSLLLALNNIFKLYFYQRQINWPKIGVLVVLMGLGSLLGALFMLELSPRILSIGLGILVVFSFLSHHKLKFNKSTHPLFGGFLSFIAGFSSGMVGISGPLKGLALKHFVTEKSVIVASAAAISLVSDSIKSVVFLQHSSVYLDNLSFIIMAFLIMPFASFAGKKINDSLSTKAYNTLFYIVMSGYVLRFVI